MAHGILLQELGYAFLISIHQHDIKAPLLAVQLYASESNAEKCTGYFTDVTRILSLYRHPGIGGVGISFTIVFAHGSTHQYANV